MFLGVFYRHHESPISIIYIYSSTSRSPKWFCFLKDLDLSFVFVSQTLWYNSTADVRCTVYGHMFIFFLISRHSVWFPKFSYLFVLVSIYLSSNIYYSLRTERPSFVLSGFSSNLSVQTGSGAHPASCTMGTGIPFPGRKARPGRDADHSPHLLPKSRMSRSYIFSPPSAFVACSGIASVLVSCSWNKEYSYRRLLYMYINTFFVRTYDGTNWIMTYISCS
jgi:hypothetical protein